MRPLTWSALVLACLLSIVAELPSGDLLTLCTPHVLPYLLSVVAGPVQAAANDSPPTEEGRIRGALAALNDEYPEVKVKGLEELLNARGRQVHSHTPVIAAFVSLMSEGQGQRRQEHSHKLVIDAIHDFEKLLGDADPRVCAAAAALLGSLGEHAKAAIPRLTELLQDNKDPHVRAAAAEALGGLGEHAKDAVPRLIELLKDREPLVVAAAARALGGLGEHAKDAIPRLIELLKDWHDHVRAAAAGALSRLGEHAKSAVPRLMELLEHKDPQGRFDPTAPPPPELINGKDPELPPELPAAEGLRALGVQAKADPDTVRAAAAEALHGLGKHAKGAAQRLTELLKDTDPAVRAAAARALGGLGEYAQDAIPRLTELLQDNKDPQVRAAAARALGGLGEYAKDAVPRLIELLKDWDDHVRAAAAGALSRLGEHAKSAVPRLMELLEHKDPQGRFPPTGSLGGLGKPALRAIPPPPALTNGKDPELPPELPAAEGLRALGMQAKADPDTVRAAAVEALHGLGKHAKGAAQRLTELLKDTDPAVRAAAARALGGLGEYAQDAISRLTELLQDNKDPQVRAAAAEALGGLGEYAKDAVPRLIELLKDREGSVGTAAAEALGRLGEHAKSAVPQLIELLGVASRSIDLVDFEGSIDFEARQALKSIPPPSIVVFLEVPYVNTSALYEVRWLAHYWGAGEEENEIWCRYLGRPRSQPKLPTDKRARCTLLKAMGTAFDQSRSRWLREDAALWATCLFASPGTEWGKDDLDVVKPWVQRLEKETDPRLTSQLPEIRRIRDRLEDRFLWLKSLGVVVAIFAFAWLLTILPDWGGVEKWAPFFAYCGIGGGAVAGTELGKLPLSSEWLLGSLIGFVGLALVWGLFSPRFLGELAKVQPLNYVALAVAHQLPWSRRRIFAPCQADTAAKLNPIPQAQAVDARALPYLPVPARVHSQGQLEQLSLQPADETVALLTGAVDQRGHVLIEAPAGTGKTALLNEVVRNLLEAFSEAPRRRPLPVFLAAGGGGIEKRAREALGDALVAPEMFSRYLQQGWFVLVLDNVSESDLTAEEITAFHQQYRGRTPLLLGSRPNPELHDAIGDKANARIVKPALLDDHTLDAFVQHCIKHLGGQPLSEKSKQACRGPEGYVPLFVRLAVVLGPDSNAESAAGLFQEYLFRQCRCQDDREKAELLRAVGQLCLKTYWVTGKRAWTFDTTDPLQSRLKDVGILVPDQQAGGRQALPKTVRFFHDSMQAYLTAEALVGEYERQGADLSRPVNDPTSTPWDHSRLLLWIAANPLFAGTESHAIGELWEMFLTIFPDREAIRGQLQSEIEALGQRYRNHLGDPENIRQSVPAPVASDLPAVYDADDTPAFVRAAAEACGRIDERTSSAALLGRMYANLARLVFERRLKSDKDKGGERKKQAAARPEEQKQQGEAGDKAGEREKQAREER